MMSCYVANALLDDPKKKINNGIENSGVYC